MRGCYLPREVCLLWQTLPHFFLFFQRGPFRARGLGVPETSVYVFCNTWLHFCHVPNPALAFLHYLTAFLRGQIS